MAECEPVFKHAVDKIGLANTPTAINRHEMYLATLIQPDQLRLPFLFLS